MVSQDQIIDKLRECLDPELGVNIVNVLMTLTTPGCPLDSYFTKDITAKLKKVRGISDVSVELTFEPPWSPTNMTGEGKDLLGFVN